MVHARNVKPPVAGATLVSIDESSVRGMPGFVQVVSKGNYVAVVCEREEQAIRAARQLKVNWQKPATAPFPASEDLFTYMRAATPTVEPGADRRRQSRRGAIAGAATVVEADYEVPFQGHTSFGPAHAHGRSVERSDDDLLERHEVVRPAQRRRAVPRHAARPRARRVDGGPAGATAARPPTMRASRRRSWRRSSAGRCACSGCGRRKRPGTPRGRPTR